LSDSKSYFLIDLSVKDTLTADELEAQRGFLRKLTEEGRLLLAGIVPSVKGRGLAVLQAASLDEANETYANAPVVMAGKADIEVNELKLTAGMAQSL
jgi:uncharacterized protein YciI